MNLTEFLEKQTKGRILIRKYRNSFSYVVIVDYLFYVHCVNYYPPTKRFSRYNFSYVNHFKDLQFCEPSKEKILWEYLKREHQKFLTKSALRKKSVHLDLVELLDRAFDTKTDLSLYTS
jgi:hypothetical protein